MPRLEKVYTLEISVEQFLDNCTENELQEVELLIHSHRYQKKMNPKALNQ